MTGETFPIEKIMEKTRRYSRVLTDRTMLTHVRDIFCCWPPTAVNETDSRKPVCPKEPKKLVENLAQVIMVRRS